MHQLTESNDRWWDIHEAADYLRVSVAFLRKQVRQGCIPFARAGSKSLRFRRADLDRWLTTNGSSRIANDLSNPSPIINVADFGLLTVEMHPDGRAVLKAMGEPVLTVTPVPAEGKHLARY